MPAGLNRSLMPICTLLICLSFSACKKTSESSNNSIELKFLDEFILGDDVMVDSTLVGGLSGIDHNGRTYYLASDDPSKPRYYKATILVDAFKITDIIFYQVVHIKDTTRYFDLESIRYDTRSGKVVLTSEGHIKSGKDPALFTVNALGEGPHYYNLPEDFYSSSEAGPRHNGSLEGLSMSLDSQGYWVGMELPLEKDGSEPQIKVTNSPVRITHIDPDINRPMKQFAYFLEAIAKTPTEDFAINGLTDILQYDTDRFIIVERSFSKGLGDEANTVKLFDVDASQATNVLKIDQLSNASFEPASKTLIMDFEAHRDQLTNKSIDNIEGLCFGPVLPNGNRTLILVADNNFNAMGRQMNQFILLEIVDQFTN